MKNRKNAVVNENPKIKFVTPDGSILMDRFVEAEWFGLKNFQNGRDFIDVLADRDAQTRGLKILSRKHDEKGFTCVVTWIKTR